MALEVHVSHRKRVIIPGGLRETLDASSDMEKREMLKLPVHGRRVVRRKRGERGFSLAMVAVCSFVLMGMMGLAFDIGRMFIVSSELQTFADASALAAASQMDGTQTGIETANSTATQGPLGSAKPNGYNFDSTTISNVTATYASNFGDSYDSYSTASSTTANTYRP